MRFCSYAILGIALFSSGEMAKLKAGSEIQEPRNVATVTRSVVSVVRPDARTGRLVRSIVVTPRAVPSKLIPEEKPDSLSSPMLATDSGVRFLVAETAKNYDVSPELVDSVIQVESNYNPYAISSKGAQGLMQLMPQTARRFGVKNSFDPKENIEAGVKYLKFLQDTFKDDRLAIAAYNAGEGAVAKYNNVPPYKETVQYVARVGRKLGQARRATEANKKAQTPAVVQEKPQEEQHRPLVQYIDADGRLHLATR
jgi:hypothetical protein